ncbi:MAG: hypothetical protein ACRDHN_13735, partial [Thermomicrobiales bacterium]
TVDGSHDRPSVFEMDAQHRIETISSHDRIDIILDHHFQAVLAIARQATGSHHSPETFCLHQETSLIRQRVGDPVVLVSRMDHDVGAVESRPFRIVVQERSAGSENIPRVINVKIHHSEPKREVDSGYFITIAFDRHELALRKNLSMIFQLFEGVGLLRGINQPANLNDRLVIRRNQAANSVIGWKHGTMCIRGIQKLKIVVTFDERNE